MRYLIFIFYNIVTPTEVNQSTPGLIEIIFTNNKREEKKTSSMMEGSNKSKKVLGKAKKKPRTIYQIIRLFG